jgi:hypothetical protein
MMRTRRRRQRQKHVRLVDVSSAVIQALPYPHTDYSFTLHSYNHQLTVQHANNTDILVLTYFGSLHRR